MKRVTQQGGDGCGIACVAMIAGVTYQSAKKRMPKGEEYNIWSPELRAALKGYGAKTRPLEPIRGRDYKAFTFDAVLLGRLGGEPHWVVWDSNCRRLLDPYEPRPGERWKFKCNSFVKVLSR